jgi:hypothetical protein
VQDVCWSNALSTNGSPLPQVMGLGFQERHRHFVVENVQRSTNVFVDFVPNFSLRTCVRGPSERNQGTHS